MNRKKEEGDFEYVLNLKTEEKHLVFICSRDVPWMKQEKGNLFWLCQTVLPPPDWKMNLSTGEQYVLETTNNQAKSTFLSNICLDIKDTQ